MQVIDDPRVGTELAGYRIESLLGVGGMSVVYLAEDLRLKRRVALKLLAPNLAEDVSFRERFLRESELAAAIDHPNIVPIYEAGTADGLLFIAMRYVEGRDLKERVQRGRLDPGDAIGIAAQVASALDAAHTRGLVHRDVKPSNVLLDRAARPDGSDHVYLADFGLTSRASEMLGIADDGQLTGTIDYVAPEEITGVAIDWRVDVYSLGCVLYECLVGQPPFRRDSGLAVVFAHLETEPPAPSAQRPELPAALDAVIATALAKEPEQRYPSCRELVAAALGVAVDEASRKLVDVAARAAAGRSDLSQVEAELTGKVVDLQVVRERERELARPTPPAGPAIDGICPFKGLASFEPLDADYFFGRERLVAELVARLVGAGFLGIAGPSGSGKSSVLRAGLLPALARGVIPGSERWRRLLLRPGEHPLEELRRVLVSGATDPLAEALDTLPAGGRLLLAVDQLEELFTACRSDSERAAFADALSHGAADPEGRAVVVVALRADFYGRFASYPDFAELLGGNQVLVPPMQDADLRRAVELPAGRVGLRVERELADDLVHDVEGEPGALPLLSTALLELWQKRQDNTLTLSAYRESGGVHGAVWRLAEGTYARVPNDRKPLVRAVMLRLVGEGEGESPVRRRAPLAELDLERNDDVAVVLATLADSRLVTVGEGSVEVAHEALMREWPRLREWIEEDAQGRRLRRHITQAATEWSVGGRDQGELYRGARLAAALDWSTDHAFELNELEREFVGESREVSERETRRVRRANRRLRVLLAAVAALLSAAVAGAIFAAAQRRDAREAERAQLAQRLGAQALVEEELDLSLLLARQAVAIDDSPQTQGYLLADLLRSPAAAGIMHSQSDSTLLRGIAVSRDGKTIALPDFLVGVVLFDARTFEQIGGPIKVPTIAESAAYSPDGATLAFGGPGYIRLIDAHTRSPLAEVRLGEARALWMAFTNDGSRLAVEESTGEGGEGWIAIRDAATLKQIGPRIEPSGFDGSWIVQQWTHPDVMLTPDGRSVVTASVDGTLTWWDVEVGERTRTIAVQSGHRPVALSRDGFTAAVGLDRGMRLIDVRTGAAKEVTGTLGSTSIRLLFSPDGKTIVSTNNDGTVTLWSVGAARPIETLRGHSGTVWEPVFSPDGETLYTAGSDGTMIAWDLGGKRMLGRRFAFTHDRGLSDFPDRHPGKFSPDGRLIALGLKADGVELRPTDDPSQPGLRLQPTDGEPTALAFSEDGRTLVAVTKGDRATIWDVRSRSLRHGPFRVQRGTDGVSISADGKILATAGDHGVQLWDVDTGAALGRIGGVRSVGDVAFSPTGSLVAFVYEGWGVGRPVEGGGDAEIWDVSRRSRIATLQLETKPTVGFVLGFAVAFSNDGRLLATAGDDPLVHIWEVGTGKLVRELEQDVGSSVWAVEFSPDGKTLAVSGGDSASLWNLATGAQIGPRLAAGSRESMLDLAPDGRRLLITSGNGHGAIWNIDPESWRRRACALANRTLTRAEWDEFLPGRPYDPACT